MSTAVDSANLILKLFELRREEKMREARNFMLTFDPKSVGDYMAGMMGPNSAHIRMVMSYWGKIEPFLPQLREMMGPTVFKNLEQVCVSAPGGIERVRTTRERIRQMLAARSSAAAS